MKSKTFMSTDWIEVHYHDSVYLAKVYLTDENEAYMVTKQNEKRRFFKVDAKLLKMGEIGFFENVMENAKECDIETVIKIGFIRGRGLNE